MYSIEACYKTSESVCSTIKVYDDAIIDQRVKVADPVLELEDNSAGSLEFTVYPTNHAYGTIFDESTEPISLMTSTVRVYAQRDENGVLKKEEIWEGRPLSIEKDFYNGKHVYCEGALCYLNDIDQPAAEYTADKIQKEYDFQDKKSVSGGRLEIIDFVKAVLIEYNKRAAVNRKFDVEGTYVNPVRIPLNYAFKGCLTDLNAIKSVPNPSERDIYQTMTGLNGYRSRGYVTEVDELYSVDDVALNDICYVTSEEDYYLYTGMMWERTDVLDYAGEYYVYAPDPKSTASEIRMTWSDVTSQIHISCGISRSTGGEHTKEAIGSIVENFGGHLKVRTVNGSRCLYYTAKIYPEKEYIGTDEQLFPQSVDFGKNLMDLTKKRDGSEFFTVLLPIGAPISNEHPETIESMCENVIENGDMVISAYEEDLTLDPIVQPFDATQQTVSYPRSGSPRRWFAKNGLDPGYTYYLFTTSYNHRTSDGSEAEQQNNYMYFLYDSGPNRPLQDSNKGLGGVSHPSYVGTLFSGETYSADDVAYYKNDRLLSMKQLSSSDTVEELVGESFHVPEKGSGNGYSLYFSCATMYARGWNETKTTCIELDSNIPYGYWDNHTLAYPRLYRAPYPDSDSRPLKVRKVDDKLIYWAGCTKYGGAVRTDIDPHKRSLYSVPVTDKYGTNDYDMHIDGDTAKLIDYHNTGRSTWHKMWDDWQAGDSDWKEDNNPNWIFPTGYTGHHVARVIVEPGKTYYLNTRVTNAGFPKTTKEEKKVELETQLPEDAPEHSIYFVGETDSFAGKEGASWSYPWGYGKNKDYTFGDDNGLMRGGREYYDVIAYAVVVRRPVYYGPGDYRWGWQVLSKKLANRSQCATVCSMEEIKIPSAIPPESTLKPGELFSFYDSEGNATPLAGNHVCHLELWFACDQCYINGNGEYDPDTGELIGYVPEVFVEDETAFGNEVGTNYKNHVTIKPLQPVNVNGDDWPEEYLINKELYDKYGPIVKVATYDEAYTPTQLMTYARNEMDKMKGEESFEVSAIDLKSCGLSDCDRLRLMQKIKINDKPHGIDASIVLSKMTIDLADPSQNNYTLGYEANRGISAM